MAANEPAGAAADETNEGEIICLDIPAGWAHHRPSTPQLVTASQTPYGWENLHFVDPISAGRRFAMPAFFVTNAASAREGEGDLRGAVGRQVMG